jgi:hypothetical protein
MHHPDTDLNQEVRNAATVFLGAMLDNPEGKVRSQCAPVAAALCSKYGMCVFEAIACQIESLITNHISEDEIGEHFHYLERADLQTEHGNADQMLAEHQGWKYLDTTLAFDHNDDAIAVDICLISLSRVLAEATRACGGVPEAVSRCLMSVVRCADHINKHVRCSAFAAIKAILSVRVVHHAPCNHEPFQAKAIEGVTVIAALGRGLADDWSPVRMEASAAARTFIESFKELCDSEVFTHNVLPPMCFNRYDNADGVRLYSQDTWKTLVGESGKARIEAAIESIVCACSWVCR